MKKIIHTDQAPKPIGPYNQGVAVEGKLVFTAGQIPLHPATGEIIGTDIKTQTRQALNNLKAILIASGTSLAKVVKTTVFLSDMGEFAAMNEVYGEYFHEAPPARTTVQVSRLPKDVKVEIEAIALVEAP